MNDMELSAYVRISQDRTGESVGVDNQRAAILKWASDNGHTVTEWYEDNDVSATSGKRRPDFERLLTDSPKALVVWTQDRLLRVTKDLERVLDTGMTVYQVNAGSLDLASNQGKAVARTVTAWATYEVEQKADRQKLKNAASAAKGEHYWRAGIRPFGHNMDGTLHPEEAPALVALIERVMNGAAVTTACRDLADAGLKTNRGQDWHPTSLTRVLKNPRIAGIRVYKGQEFKAGWSEIITEEVFRSLQMELGTRSAPRKAKSRENLLTGIALCGTCGGSMGQSRSNKGIASYRCSEFKHNGKNADMTEEVIVDRVLMLITVPGAESVLNNQPNVDIASLRKRRIEQVAWWREQLKTAQAAKVPLADLAVYREGHEAELAEIDAAIFEYEKSSLFADMWSKFAYFDNETIPEARKIWNRLPLERKRRIVSTLFEEITLLPGVRGARFDPSTVLMDLSEVGVRLQLILNEHAQGELEAGKLVLGSPVG